MNPAATDRRGVAWIAQDLDDAGAPGRFHGYWEENELNGRFLEQGPEWERAEDALAWARARAPVVLIRTARGPYYSAGEHAPGWPIETAGRWPGVSGADSCASA